MPSFDYNQDLRTMMDMFGNCDVAISLYGAPVTSIRGIYDQSNEVVSPFESDRLLTRPQVAVLDTDFSGFDSTYTLAIRGKDYQFDGKPRSDGAGLTIIHLGQKI